MMKFYLFSLGCKVNGYENNALREQFLEEGFQEEKDPSEADIIVINTCSVTHVADQKSRQHIRKFRRECPKAILAVMGCYSEANEKEVADMGADIIVGTSNRNKIIPSFLKIIHGDLASPFIDIKKNIRQERYEEMGQIAFSNQARAYLKIQDGCDNFCSYCLIPSLRGNSRSRNKDNIISETQNFVRQGYKEIVLTGIHIGKYGYDFIDQNYFLSNLINDILVASPSLYRLRLGSLESKEITDDFFSIFAKYPAIANHIHIPLQSGSSSVLQRMHRPYDTDAFLKTITDLRNIREDVAITTDIIVGFPNESEEEWHETMEFVKKARFSQIHVFPFSARKGTLAASMEGQIDPQIKQKRVQELLSLGGTLKSNYENHFLKHEVEVLFEEYKDGFAYGHTSNYLHVKIPCSRSLHGEILKIVLEKENLVN